MEKSILSEELNAMKYLLGYKRGVVISEQVVSTTGTTAAPVVAAPVVAAPVVAAPTTGTTAAPVVAAPTTGTTAAPTTAAAPATNVSMPDLIKQLQTILKTKFNVTTLGTSGPNKDGIDGVWGKNTQTAFENVLKTLPAAAAAPTTGTTTVVAGAPAAGTGTPPVSGATSSTQQKFNFNPYPNLNPENGVNFKLQTPQELAKGLTTANPKL